LGKNFSPEEETPPGDLCVRWGKRVPLCAPFLEHNLRVSTLENGEVFPRKVFPFETLNSFCPNLPRVEGPLPSVVAPWGLALFRRRSSQGLSPVGPRFPKSLDAQRILPKCVALWKLPNNKVFCLKMGFLSWGQLRVETRPLVRSLPFQDLTRSENSWRAYSHE